MDIPQQYKQLWNNWDVRVLILLSLSIQIILNFLGGMRRTLNSRLIRMILWGSYLFADWVAALVLGKLSSSMDDSSASNAIIAFWAPFLNLHLGGPDTITAYSMEDNQLWARHLLGLIYEVIVALYVLIRSLPNNHLLAATLLMFLVAIIKYVERSYSLYKASFEGFRASPSSFNISVPSNDYTLNKAFWLYSTNNTLLFDAIPQNEGYLKTSDFMRNSSFGEVLEVLSMELSYAYDQFYTKAIVSHSRAGYFLRVLCSICILFSFSIFVMVPKDDFKNVDVTITYVLLIASICLDVVASVMLVFSNRMVVSLLNAKKLSSWSMWFAVHIVRIKRACYKRRYWMIKMPQLNLFINCLTISTRNKALKERIMNWVAKKLSFVQVIMSWVEKDYTWKMMQPIQTTEQFTEIIAFYLQRHFNLTKEELKKPAGFSALQKVTTINEWAVPTLVQLFEGIPFDQQVFVWHITTELCFQCNLGLEESKSGEEKRICLEMEACKYLSNYMMYAVIIKYDEISTMGGASSEMFMRTISTISQFKFKSVDTEFKELCKNIMTTTIDWNRDDPLFTMSKMLAYLMFFISKQDRWRVMTTAWMDLLIKGANNSRGNTHLKQLSREDDLLTLIWFFNKQVNIIDEVRSINYAEQDFLDKGKQLYDQIKDHCSQYRRSAV